MEDKNLLFYNGIAIVSEKLDDLIIIQKILESDLFLRYIRSTTKDYASGYISLSRNYIKNFGVYQFSPEEKLKFLNSAEPNLMLRELYDLKYHLVAV